MNKSDYKQPDVPGQICDVQFRLLFENAPAGIALVSLDGFLQIVNPALCNLLGYKCEDLTGQHIDNLTYPQDILIGTDSIKKLLQNDLSTVQIEKRFVHKLNYIVQVIVQAGLIRDHTNKQTHFIFHLTDITQYEETNKIIYYQQKMESLGRMAGGIAHEYNNLLVGILGQATVALAKLGEAHPASKHMQKAVKSAKQAAFLTQQMLAYSGRRYLEKQSLNLDEFVLDNLPLIQAAIPKFIQIDTHLANHLPVILVDKGQLQQVLMNLILNATEAIGEQSGRITITTKRFQLHENDSVRMNDVGPELQTNMYVCLSVHDNGCGMDDETRKQIFDPFFTTKFTGRGLGLAAVKGIMVGHGGGIRVYSEVQVGTTFQLYFPVVDDQVIKTAVTSQA